ncbi:MAG: sugar phosphate nucleotidyltransferase, partial [Planctomycetota bacterium]
SDHIIQTSSQFQNDLKRAFEVCDQSIVTLGIPPSSPHIGYGYIHRGAPLAPDLYAVDRFVEKPTLEKAQGYLRSEEYYWNAGIFVFHQKTILSAFEKWMPVFFQQLKTIQKSLGDPQFSEILKQEYPKLQKISIDFGIMEKFSPIKVLQAHFSWDDVGSLSALIRYGTPSLEERNIIYGDWIGVESEGLLVHSQNHLIATLGIHDLAIIHTKDATLIAPKNRLEDLKKLGEKLTQQKREDVL